MTPEVISSTAGLIISLLFSYFPKLNTWYAGKSEDFKKLSMLVLMLAVSAGAYGLACAGLLTQLFGITLECSQQGIIHLIQSFFLAMTANQAIYRLTPQTNSVKEVKALQEGRAELYLGRG